MTTIMAIADAVVMELNREEWSIPFTARRLYRPRFEPGELRTLQVSVVPRSVVLEAETRSEDSREYQIDIAVQQKLDTESPEEIDPLVALVDEIARHFRLRRLAAMPSVLCVKTTIEPVCAVEHLDRFRCFTSVLTLTCRSVE